MGLITFTLEREWFHSLPYQCTVDPCFLDSLEPGVLFDGE
jgi:hypothetical protein